MKRPAFIAPNSFGKIPSIALSRFALATCASLMLLPAVSPAALIVEDGSSTLTAFASINSTINDTVTNSDVTFGDGALAVASHAYAELNPSNFTDVDSTTATSFTLNLTVLNFTHHWIGMTDNGATSTIYTSTLNFDARFHADEDGVLDIDYLLTRSGGGSFEDGFDYTGVQVGIIGFPIPFTTFGSGEFGLGNQVLSDSRSFNLSAGQTIFISVDSGPNLGTSSGLGVSKNETLNGTVTLAFTPAVPEPGTTSLLALGLGAFLARRRRA